MNWWNVANAVLMGVAFFLIAGLVVLWIFSGHTEAEFDE